MNTQSQSSPYQYTSENAIQKRKPSARATFRASEHQEQAALLEWWNWQADPLRDLLFAIPNGGRRDGRTGKVLQQEGVRAGVPDLFLAIPADGWHGLWIELKVSTGGRVSKAQAAMHEKLSAQKYKVVVCKGCDEAIAAIKSYLLKFWNNEEK